jgi:DnaK suppressor protein
VYVRHEIKERTEDDRRSEALRQLLARHEADLDARKQLLKEDIAPEPGVAGGSVESSADTFARDVGAALLEATARTVRSIKQALHRLEDGGYGRCVDCGTVIAAQRLRALPFAERCRDCQQRCDSEPRSSLLFCR